MQIILPAIKITVFYHKKSEKTLTSSLKNSFSARNKTGVYYFNKSYN